jgi:hypothetical protein
MEEVVGSIPTRSTKPFSDLHEAEQLSAVPAVVPLSESVHDGLAARLPKHFFAPKCMNDTAECRDFLIFTISAASLRLYPSRSSIRRDSGITERLVTSLCRSTSRAVALSFELKYFSYSPGLTLYGGSHKFVRFFGKPFAL